MTSFVLSMTSSFVFSDPNTLFRGNSLASKFIDEFMRVVGYTYLLRTLQPCIDEVSYYSASIIECQYKLNGIVAQ